MQEKIEPKLVRGIRIYPFRSMEELIEYNSVHKKMLLSVNAEIIMRADDEVTRIINENIGYADGIGAVKAIRQNGGKTAVRLPGSELWLEILHKHRADSSFYFCGSTSEVIDRVIEKLQIEFPGLSISGYRNGFFKNEEEIVQLEKELEEKKPDFVFVAAGFPFQEKLMVRLNRKHPAVYLNLGGSFDVYAGVVKRAPRFYQRLGLEWFYRLMKQPSRISRQYVLLQFIGEYYTHRL